VRDAFVAAFGFEQSDPAVATISPDAMATFLATAFADEFGAAQWGARWSTASSLEQEHRIAPDERVRLTTNANALAFRQLAEAYVMVSDLGGSALSPAAQDVVAERAIGLVGAAISSLAAERAEIGVAEERIASASALLGVQAQATAHRLGDLEGADVFAAATAANDLMTRLEASYAMTARLQRLSLLEFI
jgi:flagellar hook-associated protein 3 FlgL